MNYTSDQAEIVSHYNQVTSFYKRFWNREKNFALHFGLFDSQHKTRKQAILNSNETLAKIAGIKDGDKIVDAGCGVGASSIWLVKHFNVHVTGINIVPLHIQIANKAAEQEKLNDRVQFIEADYTKIPLADGSGDVFWAQDSSCHARDKEALIKEAYRLLKPGGRLIISDGFLAIPRDQVTDEDKIKLHKFEIGYGYLNIYPYQEMMQLMEGQGFFNVKFLDKTSEARPNFVLLQWACKLLYPLFVVLAKIHIVPKALPPMLVCGYLHEEGVARGFAKYGILYGEK